LTAAPAQPDTPAATRPAPRRLALALAGALLLLPLVEALTAVVSPLLTPSDADWTAAASWVKAGHREPDLIVGAPTWADPVLRLHLGDLLPPKKAARMDHAIYPRIWELSQRGAEAPETEGARLIEERRFGQLRARLYERAPSVLRYDFLDHWASARVARIEPGGRAVPCQVGPELHQCPGDPFNFVRPRVLEIGNQLRRALLVPAVSATMAIAYEAVPLGKELAVGAGLHHVWRRKQGDGTVVVRVLVDGREIGRGESGNRTGWQVWRFPTPAFAGRTANVRFEITSARPQGRHFGFAAEARGS
jgi:hypothetical protein